VQETLQRGPRARMRKALIDAAIAISSRGIIPSVTDVAAEAQVSRATAYRHFPSQSVLVQAMVIEALGPIWRWMPSPTTPRSASALLGFGFRRMDNYEAPLRAALRLALDQWARAPLAPRRRAAHRARQPHPPAAARARATNATPPKRAFDRLVQGLAIVFGTETMVVLKDMFGLEGPQVAQVAEWVARSLVRAAIAEETAGASVARARRTRGRTARVA
jgi:AcrR family transcriptional regulator